MDVMDMGGPGCVKNYKNLRRMRLKIFELSAEQFINAIINYHRQPDSRAVLLCGWTNAMKYE